MADCHELSRLDLHHPAPGMGTMFCDARSQLEHRTSVRPHIRHTTARRYMSGYRVPERCGSCTSDTGARGSMVPEEFNGQMEQ